MATPTAVTARGRASSEEEAAVTGVVMAVTVAAGAMLALVGLVQDALPVVALPTAVVLLTLLRHARPAAAWAATAVWCAILPMADGVALLAPAMMIVMCLAVAVGPDRLIGWVRGEWSGRDLPDRDAGGWIEDDAALR